MARRDYSEDEDFYSQEFQRKGVISVWLGLQPVAGTEDVDTLQDLCGVGYYSLDDQESNTFDDSLASLPSLLKDLSYSWSFSNEVTSEALGRGIEKARRVTIQYDFAYNPKKVIRQISADPVFLGVFSYSG